MACHELERLDEERARLTHAFVKYDLKLQNAATAGSADEWAKVKERLDMIEREWQLASHAVLEHRDRHGCALSATAMPEHDHGKMH